MKFLNQFYRLFLGIEREREKETDRERRVFYVNLKISRDTKCLQTISAFTNGVMIMVLRRISKSIEIDFGSLGCVM